MYKRDRSLLQPFTIGQIGRRAAPTTGERELSAAAVRQSQERRGRTQATAQPSVRERLTATR